MKRLFGVGSGPAPLRGGDMVERNPALLTTEVDGEIMAMSVEQGECYGLDAIASRVWAIIAQPRSIDHICAALVDEYDVDDTTCRTDLDTLLLTMIDCKLISTRSQK
jgi:hypothetical protein